MVNIVPKNVKDELLKALKYPDFRFYQSMDSLLKAAIESLIVESVTNKEGLPIERAIILHRALLLEEVTEDGHRDNVQRILEIFKDIKTWPIIYDYLKKVSDDIPKVIRGKAYDAEAAIPATQEIKSKQDLLKNMISKFLELK